MIKNRFLQKVFRKNDKQAYSDKDAPAPVEQVIERPDINIVFEITKIIIVTLLFIAITIAIVVTAINKHSLLFACCVLGAILLIAITIKRVTISLILLYQALASEEKRTQCRFEPSCSNYMLQAIEKYGYVKGLLKGIDRLRRCHYPNGGVDYP